jgi:hypothetical protein
MGDSQHGRKCQIIGGIQRCDEIWPARSR